MKLLEKIERNQSYDYVLAEIDETGTYIQRINAYTDTDAWILSRFVDKYYVDDLDITEYEDFVKENSVASRLEITDWYGLQAKVYDQFGQLMDLQPTFSIEGTAAKIEGGKIVESEVDVDTSYTVVASVGDIEERQERTVYSPIPAVEPTDVESRIAELRAEMDALLGVDADE